MARATNHNRQDSLERALQLFWEKGFHATSLKDLEKTLDMRPGSIYAAFGSKDALFQESLERYAHLSLIEIERTLQAHDSPLAGLAALMRGFAGLRDQNLPVVLVCWLRVCWSWGSERKMPGARPKIC